MALKKRLQLRNIQNVAASSSALISLPVSRAGLRYHYIQLAAGYSAGTNTAAAAMTNIAEIRVKVNGRVQRVFSGTELRDLNLLNGTAYDLYGSTPNTAGSTILPVFFAEPWLPDENSQDALAWQTKNWDTFQLEVQFGAASTPTLTANAVVDDSAVDSGNINKIVRIKAAAAGTSFDIPTLDRKDWLRSLHVYPDSGASNAISQLTFRINGDIKHEYVTAANAALLTQYGMTPAASGRTANIYDMVLDHDGLLGSAYPLGGASDVSLTIAAASAMSGTSTVFLQRIGTPD